MSDTSIPRYLSSFASALIDQEKARPIIKPYKNSTGFWFGGGNMIEVNSVLYLSGRYRNYGDSRTGLGMGERGLELALFCSTDKGDSWEKIEGFSKSDLDVDGRHVLSIEGSALHQTADGVELFISTEKEGRIYGEGLESYQKAGTGIWSIDRIAAPEIADLDPGTISEVTSCDDPRYIHVKDPFVYNSPDGNLVLGFCTHPFSWTTSNTGYLFRDRSTGNWSDPVYDHFPRGTTWDAAMTRATAVIDVPSVGVFRNQPTTSLVFYDGGESVRNLDEHKEAISRPRGYSCEELGGAGFMVGADFTGIERLSVYLPMFVSPNGAGTSRYVDVLRTKDGYYATWQQSQKDFSQPLVMNFLSHKQAEELLS